MTLKRMLMITTMASPALAKNAGERFQLDDAVPLYAQIYPHYARDLDKEAEAAGTSAAAVPASPAPASTEPAKTETDAEKEARLIAERAAATQAEQVRETAAKLPAIVQKALDQLKGDDDDDWTAGGLPNMSRVKELSESKTLTRDELSTMFPDFKRPAKEVTPARTGSGGRTNT